MSVVLYMVTAAIRLVCSVSSMTPLLWSVHVHMIFCPAPYAYHFFAQVDALRTGSIRQSKECLTERIDNHNR